jgi:N-acetylneuraminic acid mutarotase
MESLLEIAMKTMSQVGKLGVARVRKALGWALLTAVASATVHLTAAAQVTYGGTWQTVAPLTLSARASHGVAEVAGKIYAIGGIYADDAVVPSVEAYDAATNTWSYFGPMSRPRWEFGTAVMNGKIYIVGGYYGWGWYASEVDEFDPATGTWLAVAPFPVGRVGPQTVALNNKLYAFGGAGPYVYGDTYEYDPAGNSWTPRAPMNSVRHGHAAVALDGKAYAIGGYDAANVFQSSVEVYDPTADTWTYVAPMSVARAGPAVAALNGKIYVIGGFTSGATSEIALVEEYDPATNTWRQMTAMPTARMSVKGAVLNGEIYAVGGYASYIFLNQVEKFAPLFAFRGFFQPVDNLPSLNAVKAGRAIPVKFSLGGDKGLAVIAEGYPRSEVTACDSTVPVDGIETTVTAGASSLSYDVMTGQYTYVWKTNPMWANTCRQLVVKLTDSTVHRANFKFK